MRRNDEGASELLDETLIIAMGLVLAVVIMVLVSGVIPFTEKTAYVVPAFGIANVSSHTVITIFDRGGEPVYFNGSPLAKYKADVYIDTQSGSYKAVPSPALTVFKPGDTIYAYYTGSGFALTNSPAGAVFSSLPPGKIAIRFVDATSGVLIAKQDLVQGPVTVISTAIPVTTTASATATATPTPTLTVIPLAAHFNWSESGSSGNVRFTDTSTGGPTSRLWDFGDGATATTPNPVHKFTKGASYDVTLTITRSPDGATSTITRTVAV